MRGKCIIFSRVRFNSCQFLSFINGYLFYNFAEPTLLIFVQLSFYPLFSFFENEWTRLSLFFFYSFFSHLLYFFSVFPFFVSFHICFVCCFYLFRYVPIFYPHFLLSLLLTRSNFALSTSSMLCSNDVCSVATHSLLSS